jgi:hypothetical protein
MCKTTCLVVENDQRSAYAISHSRYLRLRRLARKHTPTDLSFLELSGFMPETMYVEYRTESLILQTDITFYGLTSSVLGCSALACLDPNDRVETHTQLQIDHTSTQTRNIVLQTSSTTQTVPEALRGMLLSPKPNVNHTFFDCEKASQEDHNITVFHFSLRDLDSG